jgi:hypothetical protein
MYYPYLRGKQFELILLKDNSRFINNNNIHPIIEPVKSDFAALNRAIAEMCKNRVECTLIANPKAGKNPVKTEMILDELFAGTLKKCDNVAIGYILYSQSKLSKLLMLLEKYKKFNFSIIHCGYTNGKYLSKKIEKFKNIKKHIFIEGFAGKLYQRQLKNNDIKRILIRNGFKPRKKNADYPPSEHFSDLHITYPDEGMDGFGDYLIVGDDYSETGGPAYAVAIHLTYLDLDEDMFIYHFVSDQTDSPTDPGGKFLEALKKLVTKAKDPASHIYKSKAVNMYLDLYKKKHYPGLGYVKKLSMQHHIELIAKYLRQEN